MRRPVFVLSQALLIILLAATASSALAAQNQKTAAWKTYADKSLGFSFKYPATWILAFVNNGVQAVQSRQGGPNYSLTASLLPIKAVSSLAQTLQRFIVYQGKTTQSTMFAHAHWAHSSVGGKPAMAAVVSPPTEGGTSVSNGIYVTQRGTRAYEIVIVTMGRHALTQINQFPAIYGQILATWRFV